MPSTLYLIDGHYHIYRSFFGMRPLTNSAGEQVHCVYSIVGLLQKLLDEENPTRWAIAMDAPGKTFRHEDYADYKAGRPPMPPEMKQQLQWIDEALEGLRIPVLRVPGYEADDVIASLATQAGARGEDVRILSRDKDLEQVLSDRVKFFDPASGDVYGPEELEAKKGITPNRVVEYQSLIGDSSDNIPGVPGIGPKTAVKLLAAVDDVEDLLTEEPDGIPPKTLAKVRAHEDDLKMSRHLAKLVTDVPLEGYTQDLTVKQPDAAKLRPLYLKLGFRRYIDKLDASDDSLFGNEEESAQPQHIEETKAQVVDDLAALETHVAAWRAASQVALHVVASGEDTIESHPCGIAIATEVGSAFYVPLPEDDPQRLELLLPLLTDASIAKIGHHLKVDSVLLSHRGVRLEGIACDTRIAAYLMNPSRNAFEFDSLIGEYLDAESEAPLTSTTDEAIAESACRRVDLTLQLANHLLPLIGRLELGGVFELELGLIGVLGRMQTEGLTLDQIRLSELESEVAAHAKKAEKAIYEAAGHEFNIKSPKQLQTVLFEEQELKASRKTKTGYSTSAEVLEELAATTDNPLPALILDYRSHTKLLNTYIEALPKLVKPKTGRLHTDLRQAVAATGRLSSHDPNLQNIPVKTELGRRIRQAFVPNHSDYHFLSADYSQIELRLLAHLSGDPTLIETLTRGEDIHRRVAATLHDKEPEDVTRNERNAAKAVNFGVIYGMGAFGLARELDIPFRDAKKYIETFFAGYPGIRDFIDRTIEEAKAAGEVRTLLGRRRQVPELHSRVPHIRSQGERFAVNTVVQGSAADLIKIAMVEMDRFIHEHRSPARMLLQIHDELLFETPKEHLERLAKDVERIMVSVHQLDVPLVVNVSTGDNWYDASK